MTRLQIREFLAPAREVLLDPNFWLQQQEGLALFMAPGLFESYRVPVGFEEDVKVNDHLHLMPLLPLFNSEGIYHVLAFSHQQARLFRGDRFTMRDVTPAAMPRGFDEEMGRDEGRRTLDGLDALKVYGHAENTHHKDEMAKYLRMIDEKVVATLGHVDSPVVLVAVDWLMPLYRAQSRLTSIIGMEHGNPDRMTEAVLHKLTWPTAEPFFQREQQEALELLPVQAVRGMTSDDLKELVLAAGEGRIGTLFVDPKSHCWGQVEPEEHRVSLHEIPRSGDEDLVDRTALESFMHGARVFTIDSEELPDRVPVMGVLRW